MKYYFSNKPDSLSSGGLNPNVNSDKFQTNWNVLLNYLSPEIEPDKTNSPSSSILSQQNLNNQDEQENRTIDLVGLANSTMPSGMLIYTSTSAVTVFDMVLFLFVFVACFKFLRQFRILQTPEIKSCSGKFVTRN